MAVFTGGEQIVRFHIFWEAKLCRIEYLTRYVLGCTRVACYKEVKLPRYVYYSIRIVCAGVEEGTNCRIACRGRSSCQDVWVTKTTNCNL